MRFLVVKKVMMVLGVLAFGINVSASLGSVSESGKTKAIHVSYNSINTLYKRLNKKCNYYFGQRRMIADEPLKKPYTIEIVSLMPEQKIATALCISKAPARVGI